MTRPHVPQEVLDAAHARKAARLSHNFDAADRLKGEIEALGWRIVDRGVDFALAPLHPADVAEEGRTLYGWSGGVPSRLDEPAVAPATVIVRAGDDAATAELSVGTILGAAPAGTQVVIVADGAASDVAEAVARVAADRPEAVEVVWVVARQGTAAAINAGLRRAAGAVVIVLGAGARVGGDVVTPLLAALADPTVAVAGAQGQEGPDIQSLAPAPLTGDVAALDDTCLAMRRDDAAARGPLDERFRSPRLLAAWWSLVLRDEEDGPTRRALVVPGLPVSRDVRAEAIDAAPDANAGERDRLARRDRYRLLDAFRDRDDLLVGDLPD